MKDVRRPVGPEIRHFRVQYCRGRSPRWLCWTNRLRPNVLVILVAWGTVIAGLVAGLGPELSQPKRLLQPVRGLGGLGIVTYAKFLAIAPAAGPISNLSVTVAAGAVEASLAGGYGSARVLLGRVGANFSGRTLGRWAVKVLLGKVIRLSKYRGEVHLA